MLEHLPPKQVAARLILTVPFCANNRFWTGGRALQERGGCNTSGNERKRHWQGHPIPTEHLTNVPPGTQGGVWPPQLDKAAQYKWLTGRCKQPMHPQR